MDQLLLPLLTLHSYLGANCTALCEWIFRKSSLMTLYVFATCSIHASYNLLDLLTFFIGWRSEGHTLWPGSVPDRSPQRSHDNEGDIKWDRGHKGLYIWWRFKSVLQESCFFNTLVCLCSCFPLKWHHVCGYFHQSWVLTNSVSWIISGLTWHQSGLFSASKQVEIGHYSNRSINLNQLQAGLFQEAEPKDTQLSSWGTRLINPCCIS